MILLRHGQSEFNAAFNATRVDPGIPDPRLTEEGKRQVQLVDRQRLFQRCSLTIVIPGRPVCGSKVQPQGRLGGIGAGRRRQMFDGLFDITSFERIQPKLV